MRHPIRDGILIFFLAYFIVISYFQSVHHRRAIEAAKNAEQSADPDVRSPAAAAAASSNSDVLSLPGAAAVDGGGNADAAENEQEQQEKGGQEEDQETTVVMPAQEEDEDTHREPKAAGPAVDSTTVRSTSTSAAPEVDEGEVAAGNQGVPIDTTVVVGALAGRDGDRPVEHAAGDQEGPLGVGGGVDEPEAAAGAVVISGSSGEAEGLRPLVNEGEQAADREGEGLRPLVEDVGKDGEGWERPGEEGSAAPTGHGGGTVGTVVAASSDGRSSGGIGRVSRMSEGVPEAFPS